MEQSISKSVEFSTLEIKANYTCNSKCPYCCARNHQGKRTMTLQEIMTNADYFLERHAIREICLSGGEPTVHPDFLASLDHFRSRDLGLYLHTNAIRFSEKMLSRECTGLVDRALAGLSCHDEQSCASLTGTVNTFAKRIQGIRNLLEASVPVRTNTVVLKANYRFLPEIAQVIGSLRVSKALFTLPFFFGATSDQVDEFVPEDFATLKEYLARAIHTLHAAGIQIFLQGLPPCKLGEFKDLREIDPDRAFVDSEYQLDKHRFLFSGMLGYKQDVTCKPCNYRRECWGFPAHATLGSLGKSLGLR
jgi:MoaA/NifB/PqqE/SkfB family radical SAM enzyme